MEAFVATPNSSQHRPGYDALLPGQALGLNLWYHASLNRICFTLQPLLITLNHRLNRASADTLELRRYIKKRLLQTISQSGQQKLERGGTSSDDRGMVQ